MKRIIKITYFCAIIIMMATMFSLNAQVPFQPTPVGAIPGAVDVSPTGAATYSIPIEVVPGTQGMQPNLSIVYNSMGGMGLLGMKWNLGGLSSITRCGQTPYYDNNITEISFGSQSRFALDGERLINISGGYHTDGAVYATEMENFNRIVSHGYNVSAGLFIPKSFTAYTDDGSIIEYGSTENSRLIVENLRFPRILSWCIDKITDANGNYMTFTYGNSNKEIWIQSIQYTGNGSMQPYAKVEFSYTTLPDNMGKNTYYVDGYGISQTKLLETITIKYENSAVRKYQFNYNTNDAGERTTHLKEIVLSEYDEKGVAVSLNPTNIIWNAQNNSIDETSISGFSTGQIIYGDFNGDGYTDYALYNIGSGADKTYQMYIWDHVNKIYTKPINTDGHSYECQAYVGDYDGDGKDELILAECTNGSSTYKINVIKYDGYNYNYPTTTVKNNINYFYQLHLADFNGDGKVDIMYETRKSSYYPEKILSFLNFNCDGFLCFPVSNTISIADVNGCGKAELLVSYMNTDIYTYNSDSHQFSYSAQSFMSNIMDVYYGDFNGDGCIDMIHSNPTTVVKVGKINYHYYENIIKFGDGSGGFNYSGNIINFPFQWYEKKKNEYYPYYSFFIADLNGDGKDDIIQPVFDTISSKTKLHVYYSKGCVNNKYIYDSSSKTITGDYSNLGNSLSYLWYAGENNGDGKSDLFLRKHAFDTQPKIISFNKNEQYEFVKEIEDGMGKKNDITYIPKYLSFFASSLAQHKKVCVFLPSKLQTSNGIGGVTELQFSYRVPWYSFPRRTFLGFYEFVTKNTIENTTTVDSLFFVPDNLMIPNQPLKHEILLPYRKSHTVNGYRVNETYYSFDTIPLPNKRYILHAKSNTLYDYLSNSKTGSSTTLENGRIKTSTTNTYNASNSGSWILSETNTFTYETITLNGYQKKTVPKTVLTTQQYGSGGLIIADTTTYSYYTDPTNKGRLKSMRQGNTDGSITTTYDYTSQGVCKKKTVSAQGVPSRSETYSYFATYRFIYEIKNELGHTINFDYNHKTGDKIWEKDANGLETNYKYGVFGQLKQIDYPDGTYTRTNTDWLDEPYSYFTQIFSTGKPTVEIYYDILGREVERLDDGSTSQIQYNAKGQVVSTSSLPFWSEYTYDNLGRVIEEKAPYTHLTYSYSNRKTTTYDNLREISSYKDYDALGRIIQANDEGGTINYTYEIVNDGGKKRHKTTVSNNTDNSFTTILSDLWGNRLSITEPNAQTITSEYNKFNELIKQTDANGNITLYSYDILGRVTSKSYTKTPNSTPYPPAVAYTYDTGNKAIGKLSKIEMGGSIAEEFTYDNLSRLSSHTKHIGGTGKFSYTYNANGQLQTLKYPGGGFAVNYTYTSTGKLKEIRRSSDNSLIYEVKKRNYYNLPTHCIYGNNSRVGINTTYAYNYYGLVTQIRTTLGMVSEPHDPGTIGEEPNRGNGVIMDYNYTYNDLGLMTSRAENVVNQQESFTYDKLDRLTKNKYYDFDGKTVNQTFDYALNGNITQNSQVGNYVYDGVKPHAVTQITNVNENLISENECVVTYNLYNQPKTITEGDYELELSYGANQQRNKAVLKKNDTIINTRYYYNKYYEKEVDSAGRTFYYHYIYGDNGVVALHIANRVLPKDSSDYYELEDGEEIVVLRGFDTIPTDYMYYIHTDHVGSYCAITNEAGEVVQRNSFDPWGNYAFEKEFLPSVIIIRESSDTLPGLSFPITTRGFTGHEHYPFFKIINMNGRLYDPVIARFFSPDKYVANSSFTQDFNRYTYCRNNPLMYTDPDGEILWFIPLIYIGVSAAINVAVNYKTIQETAQKQGGWAAFGKAMGYFGTGAVNGAVSWYCPALSPIASFGTSILEQGLKNNNFNDINYNELGVNAAVSMATSIIGNGVVNSTIGKVDFFKSTLVGNMIKGVVKNNISSIGSALFISSLYNNGDASKGWEYYKEMGWLPATLSGMNEGVKTHYQNNSRDLRDVFKKDYKDQMKNPDFRKTLTKTMKDDIFLSKFDRFELQMYRLNIYTSNPFILINRTPNPILQINVPVEPEIPTPVITLPIE